MKRLIPDTVFARLFALVLAALVASHLITGILLGAGLADHRPPGPPPPGMEHPGEQPPPPPPEMAGRPPEANHPPGPPRHDRSRLWLILLVQFLALSGAAWVGARMVARPMRHLADAAARLGENIDEPPMAESGPEEARQAAQVFNRMQDRIRSQIETRGRFLAAVSHDLRTPLTRMKLRVEQLDGATPGRDKLQSDISEMAAMLDATLNYLRGESQSESWQLLDLQSLVETLVEDARENGDDVTVSGQVRPLRVQPMALRRCLGNLLENALRYGERAEIALAEMPGSVVIEIRDRGPGIPENRMAQVFEPFVRLEESRNRNTGGVGLGLAIAREAARRHGGELSLRNAADGGLIARLTLPRQAA